MTKRQAATLWKALHEGSGNFITGYLMAIEHELSWNPGDDDQRIAVANFLREWAVAYAEFAKEGW